MSIPQRLKLRASKSNQYWKNPKLKIGFKILLSVLSMYYLWQAVLKIDWSIWLAISGESVAGLILLVALNWSTESWKWRIALRNSHRISFVEALRQVCIGVAVGFFTPGRLGELAGRSALQSNQRRRALGAAALSSMAQGATTMLIGIVAVFYFGRSFVYGYLLVWFLGFLGVLFVSLLLVFFVFPSFFIQQLRKLPFNRLPIILVLSFVRYAVFIAEFVILLRVVPVSFGLLPLAMAIGLYYFVGNFSPVFTFAEGGLKVLVASITFPLIAIQAQIAMAVVLMVWLLNLTPPVLFGIWVFWRRK